MFINIRCCSIYKCTDKLKLKPLHNHKKEFNDWFIYASGDLNALQNTDLNYWQEIGYFAPRYDLKFQLNKPISHAFGLSLEYLFGKTIQKGTIYHNTSWGNVYQGKINGESKYNGISILADINDSNLLKRVDYKSEFNRALHLH